MPRKKRNTGARRTTVHLEPGLHRALKVKAASTDRTLSDLVNEAVRLALREDALDLDALRRRTREPSRAFERVLANLRRNRL